MSRNPHSTPGKGLMGRVRKIGIQSDWSGDTESAEGDKFEYNYSSKKNHGQAVIDNQRLGNNSIGRRNNFKKFLPVCGCIWRIELFAPFAPLHKLKWFEGSDGMCGEWLFSTRGDYGQKSFSSHNVHILPCYLALSRY